MAISFISLSPYIQQAKQNEEAKQKADVAAVVASNEDDPKLKKQGSNRADVAAVLAMSEQPPLNSDQRDLCLA